MLLLIVTACQSGFYGQDCAFTCGNCDGGAPCNAVDGTCSSGCAPGWTGDTCNEGKIVLTLIAPSPFPILGNSLSKQWRT